MNVRATMSSRPSPLKSAISSAPIAWSVTPGTASLFHPTQAVDFDNDGYDDLPIAAAPSFPTPFYDERPSKVFVVRGGAHGLTSEPALTLSGAPGYGVAFTAGD